MLKGFRTSEIWFHQSKSLVSKDAPMTAELRRKQSKYGMVARKVTEEAGLEAEGWTRSWGLRNQLMQGDTRGWSTGKYRRLDEGVGMRVLAPATVAGSYSSHGRSSDETGHV